jgi:hypothetical protein
VLVSPVLALLESFLLSLPHAATATAITAATASSSILVVHFLIASPPPGVVVF